MTDADVRAASALVEGEDGTAAVAEAAARVRASLGAAADLAAVFISPALARDPDAVLGPVHDALAPRALVGCTGEAVIGTGREVEGRPAVVVWGARLPGARIDTFEAVAREDADGGVVYPGWPEDPPDAGSRVHIVLADPFTFPMEPLLASRGRAGGRAPLVGGLASGGQAAGEHVLFVDRSWTAEGAVGVVVSGVPVRVGVSQGCAPIGPEMVVTEAGEGGVVYALAGRPALAKLEQVLEELDPATRALAADGLLMGLVVDENRPDYRRGDFLIRGILGADPDSGAVVMGERVRVGQTVRLHVRDAASATDDLRSTLRSACDALARPPAGVLLFSCNGRGTHMFPHADHDASLVAHETSDAAIAGLFCNGEIGPVGGRSFMHGFTATMAVFGGGNTTTDT